jgi:adenine-specific DNA-methyltransferase
MAAKFPYYLLADSPDGRRKEMEVTGKFIPGSAGVPPAESGVAPDSRSTNLSSRGLRRDAEDSPRDAGAPQKFAADIKRGFVCKRVPHVTLKAIANNEEIDAIHAEVAPRLEKSLAAVNKAAKKNWPEREVPRELTTDFTDDKDKKASVKSVSSVVQFHSEFWQLRRERQQKIDASIARRADTVVLYDQPYEDKKRIRVTGPFTVATRNESCEMAQRPAMRPGNVQGTIRRVGHRQNCGGKTRGGCCRFTNIQLEKS